MRIFAGKEWANLRLSTYSSYFAGFFSTFAYVDEGAATAARCLARSQMGYVVGCAFGFCTPENRTMRLGGVTVGDPEAMNAGSLCLVPLGARADGLLRQVRFWLFVIP
jgi:hypothetical protein